MEPPYTRPPGAGDMSDPHAMTTRMTLKSVAAWVAMQQSLKAIEAVGRFWATQLGLEQSDVLLMLLLGRRVQTPTTLGHVMGRRRQQVHRSLLRLEAQGLVTASEFTRRGKVAGWKLSSAGLLRLECLERRMGVWEEHLVERVDVEKLLGELRATLRSLVNRTMEGFFAGLYVPEELRRDPNLTFLKEAEALRESMAELRAQPSPTEQRKAAARKIAEDALKEEAEALSRDWTRLFQ